MDKALDRLGLSRRVAGSMAIERFHSPTLARHRVSPLSAYDWEDVNLVHHFSRPVAVAGGRALDGMLLIDRRLQELGFGGTRRWLALTLLAMDTTHFVDTFYENVKTHPDPAVSSRYPAFRAVMNSEGADPRAPLVAALGEFRGPFTLNLGGKVVTYPSMLHLLRDREAGIVGSTRPLDDMRKLTRPGAYGTRPKPCDVLEAQMAIRRFERESVRRRLLLGAHASYDDAATPGLFKHNWIHCTAPGEAPNPWWSDMRREAQIIYGGQNSGLASGLFGEEVIKRVLSLSTAREIPGLRAFPLIDIAFMATCYLGEDGRVYVHPPKEQRRRIQIVSEEISRLLPKRYKRWHFGARDVEYLLHLALYLDRYLMVQEHTFALQALRDGKIAAPGRYSSLVNSGYPNLYFEMSSPRFERAPEIVVLVAPRGTGKTTALNALLRTGWIDGALQTVKFVPDDSKEAEEGPGSATRLVFDKGPRQWREVPGPSEEGLRYEVIAREAQSREMLHNGFFAAVSSFDGLSGYGIPEREVRRVILQGGRWGIVTDPFNADHVVRQLERVVRDVQMGGGNLPTPKVTVLRLSAALKEVEERVRGDEEDGARSESGERLKDAEIQLAWLDRHVSALGFADPARPVEVPSLPDLKSSDRDKRIAAEVELAWRIGSVLGYQAADGNMVPGLSQQPQVRATRYGPYGCPLIPEDTNPRRVLVMRHMREVIAERRKLAAGERSDAIKDAMKALAVEMYRWQVGEDPGTNEEDRMFEVEPGAPSHANHILETFEAAGLAYNRRLVPEDKALSDEIHALVAPLMPKLDGQGRPQGIGELEIAALGHDDDKLATNNHDFKMPDGSTRVVHTSEQLLVHDRDTFRRVRAAQFFRMCSFPAVDDRVKREAEVEAQKFRMQGIAELAYCKYHHLIGHMAFQGSLSWLGFSEALRDGETWRLLSTGAEQNFYDTLDQALNNGVQVRDVVATAKGAPEKLGHLDPRAAEAFIDRLTAITFIDVGGKGFMGRLRARRYLELRKRLKKELCNGQQKVTYAEAITRIEQIAREETTLIEWLEALAAPLDKSAAHTGELMHERPSGLGTYEPAARAALTPCPAWGISDTYIRIVKQYRPQICMPYADYLMFATPTDGVERTGEAVRINPVFIKAMALAALGVFTLTQENEVQAHEIVEVVFVDANFRLPRTLHTTTRDIPMFAPIVAELNRLLSNGEDPTASVNKGDITLVYPPRGQERDPRDPVPTYGRRRIYIQLNRLNLDREEGRL